MASRNWSKIVLGKSSGRAMLLHSRGQASYPHASREATVEIFEAVLVPDSSPVRLVLEYDALSYASAHADLLERFGFAPQPREVFSDLLISNLLDGGAPTPTNGTVTIAIDSLLEELISSYRTAPQSELSYYVESKTYESWRFGLEFATFGVLDAVILGTTVNTLDRVAAIDRNILWTLHSQASDGFALAPTQRLLQERRDAEREAIERRNALHRSAAAETSHSAPAIRMKAQDHYDVALSFAGENREYVDRVAAALKDAGIVIFYDEFERVNLWGRNLLEYFTEVYYKRSDYMVIFISEHYASKVWTKHERQSGQARAFEESREYILPARFDDTDVPGILPTTRYEDLREMSPESFAELIVAKHRVYVDHNTAAADRGEAHPRSLTPQQGRSAIRPKVEMKKMTFKDIDLDGIAGDGIVADNPGGDMEFSNINMSNISGSGIVAGQNRRTNLGQLLREIEAHRSELPAEAQAAVVQAIAEMRKTPTQKVVIEKGLSLIYQLSLNVAGSWIAARLGSLL